MKKFKAHINHPGSVSQKEECQFSIYSSMQDLIDTPVPDCNLDMYENTVLEHTSGDKWYGLGAQKLSGAKVMGIISKGWQDGRLRAEREFRKHIKLPEMPSIVRRRRWSSTGDTIDMQRVYTGNLDQAWQITKRDTRGGMSTHVMLTVDIGGSCNRSPDEFFWRGTLAALLADALIISGRSVKIVLGQSGINWTDQSGQPKYMETNLVLKEFHQPMTLESIITATSLCGWFRTYGFKMILAQDQKIRSGLGHHSDYYAYGAEEPGKNITRININQIWDKHEAINKAEQVQSLLLNR